MSQYRSEEVSRRYRSQQAGPLLRRLVLLLALGAAAWAYFAWPRVDVLETAKTSEYPDLKPHHYAAGVSAVADAARKSLDQLGWTYSAAGSGPGGSEITASAPVPILRLPTKVTVRVRREGALTVVDVRSRSGFGPADFGQNARNLRAFLAELDRRVPPVEASGPR